jgi:chromate transporter
VILLGLGYEAHGHSPLLASVLAGMSAAACGLIVVMALRMALGLPRRWRSLLVAALALLGISLLHLPLWLVLASLAPLGMVLLRGDRRDAGKLP